jgi:tellurite resistance protein TerC
MSPLAWASTLALIVGLLTFDLVLSNRRTARVGVREAAIWSAFYIAVACLFGLVFGLLSGWDLGTQYFAGYVVEKSLSVDNLFVFAIVMARFAVPTESQPWALTSGVVIALVLRAVLILVGAALLDAFSFVFLIFGLALILTAVQLLRHRDEDPSVQDNAMVSLARRALPVSDVYDERRLLTRMDGRRALTPMALALVAIGTTDLLFALDSIPAVFGVTQHTFVVFASNAFALLGLRPLFFLISGLLDRLVYLSTGLSVILAFIGVKLVLHFGHTQNHGIPEISTGASLGVILIVLALTAIASVVRTRRHPALRAHPGALRRTREDSRETSAGSEPQS